MKVVLLFALAAIQSLMNNVASENTQTYDIPISINPIIQSPIELSVTSKMFYDQDPDFYSNVTITDVSLDTEESLKDIVEKKLSVVLLTIVSSKVGKTLKKSHLKYLSGSKWSYTIPVQELLLNSDGKIAQLNEEMELYKFQQLGVMFLEKRYDFNMTDIQNQLGLSMMEFFGASEEQWIKIVGLITEKIVKRRSEQMSLTSCYLADLLNKSVTDISAFTLNEVDEHIYNLTTLKEKLPSFKEVVLEKVFNFTTEDLVSLSRLNSTTIQDMGLQDQIKLLTETTLKRFKLSIDEISTKQKRSKDELLTPCPSEWQSFLKLVVEEAFEMQATNLTLSNKTLASLIQIPYTNISQFSLEQMENLIQHNIREIKEKKNMIEQEHLKHFVNSQAYAVNLEENAFFIIEAVTNFSKSELSLIYGWEGSHYHFAKIFSVADLIHSCSTTFYNYTLLELSKINAGEGNDTCNTFSVLRMIWDKETISEIEKEVGNQTSNSTIEDMLFFLSGGNLMFIYRVLNISEDARVLCANVTLDHISMATSYSTTHLKQMTFQNMIDLAVELKANGTLFQKAKKVS